MQIDKFASGFPFFDEPGQLLLAIGGYPLAGKDVGDGYTNGNHDDEQRTVDGIMGGKGHFTHHALHVDDTVESAIHQYARNHRDTDRDGDALVGSMEQMHHLDIDDTDNGRAAERAHDGTHAETDIAIGRPEIDEIAGTYGQWRSTA